jgi:RND family efflux transporter MFP subunit
MLMVQTGSVPAEPKDAPPEVQVSQPVAREVTDHQDFTGRTDAAESVAIRPRVSGYLVKVAFKEGADIRKGELMFEIDPRPYQAELAQAQAQVELQKARLKLAEATLDRLRALAAAGNAVKQEVEEARAALDEAKARLMASQAAVDNHKLNLLYCRIESPIDGVAGRSLLTAGNFAKQDDTLLTTVVGKDPMYAYFDMDERTYLDMRQAVRDSKLKATELPAAVGLANEDGFPHKAALNFLDNHVDPSTGALRARVVLPNGDGRLVPGLFVRVRLTTSDPYKALLVPDKAVRSAAGEKWVLVVNDKNVAERRSVVGESQYGFLAVKKGLKPDDRVIIGYVKNPVRPVSPEGKTVKPVTVPQQTPPKELR